MTVFKSFGLPEILIVIIIVVLVVIGAITVIKSVIKSTKNKKSDSILRERFAKGEITKEQFEQMKKDLS